MTPTSAAASAPAMAPANYPPAMGETQPGDVLPALQRVGQRRSGYGLPCAKCRTYYAANLASCPVCQTADRVAPLEALTQNPAVTEEPPISAAEAAALEEERERFLQEFKAQTFGTAATIDPAANFRCTRADDHMGASEPAPVCESCYDSVLRRADLAEAALHIDVNEATQIIYDAVWSDPSNPGRTYQNAALALLGELRRRAGISSVIGPLRTLTD